MNVAGKIKTKSLTTLCIVNTAQRLLSHSARDINEEQKVEQGECRYEY